ncbi:MAG: Crp/Fnr family transcriptional regulator [Trueperaceae bacterium]|nr:Crp/Fnr family transcriptional regulator [Trueperaceae bacterium]
MVETLDAKETLANVPLFKDAPERALEVAASVVQLRQFPAGTTLFQEGDMGEALYIMHKGLVKLSKVDLGGYEKTLAILQPPEFFGEMALLGDKSRSATALTLGEVEAYLLFEDDFNKLIQAYPQVSINLTTTLAKRLSGTNDEAQILSYKDAQGRVAYVILRLYRSGVIELSADGTAVVQLTHQELANLAGTSRETVTRALKVLEKQDVIRTRPKEIIVIDIDGLEEILHGIRE